LNLGGIFSNGGSGIFSITPSIGTVNFNKAGAQTVGGYSYYNLIFSGSGVKSMVTGTSVAGNLSIWGGGSTTASIGTGLNLSVNSLTLGDTQQVSGTHGSTSSTATNPNNTYFAATTGRLTVAASGPPILLTRTAGANPSTYGDSVTFQALVNPDPGDGSTVNFYANGVALGTATTTSGTASLTPEANALPGSGGTPSVVTASCVVGTPVSGTLSGGQQVNPLTLTVSNATAANKYYDATTATTVGGTLVGLLAGDSITLSSTGNFADASIGNNKPVTFALSPATTSYTLTQPGITANILDNALRWINPAGGGWDTAINWQDGVIASGSPVIADFSTLDITADPIVSLGSARTVGSLTFGDTNTGSASGWTLDNGGTAANTLTLGGATPTITVSALGAQKSATISAIIDGTAGVIKIGVGALVLGGENIFTGTTAIRAGTLSLGVASALPVATNVTLGSSGTAGTLDLAGYSQTIASVGIGSGATAANQTIGNSSTSANSTLTVNGTSTFGGIIRDAVGTGDKTLALALTGGTVILSGANTYSGGTTLSSGVTLDIRNTTALGAGPFTINGGTLKNGSGGTAYTLGNDVIWNASFATNLGNSVTLGAVTLNADTTLDQQTTVNANLSVGPLSGAYNLTKTGVGKLLLIGASPSFTGGLIVSGGTLFVRESIPNVPSITVASGGTLDVFGIATAVALGSGQTLKASATGLTTTATITTGLNKGLTLSAGGLAFTAYVGGPTAPLTVAGTTAGTLDLNGAPIAITSGALMQGSYILVAKSGSAAVTGNPGALTVNGGAAPAGWTVAQTSGQLVLTVVTIPSSPFESWAATNAGGQAPNLDFDNDGVTNGVEFFMNAPAGFTANPVIVNGKITWPNGGNIPSSAYGTQFWVQTSPDLLIWSNIVEADLFLNNAPGFVEYTIPTGAGKLFVRLVVTPAE